MPAAFLDITALVESGGEEGLLGVAFHPDLRTNRRFFVHYTRRIAAQLQSVVSEFASSAINPNLADASSERILLVVNQPFDNHNGGQLAFGPDGFLYIAFGDGGSGGDPLGNGQNLLTLLGKSLPYRRGWPPRSRTAVCDPGGQPLCWRRRAVGDLGLWAAKSLAVSRSTAPRAACLPVTSVRETGKRWT